MNIGKLRHRVTFQRATEEQNDYGEPIPTWADLATVWCSVEATAGRERFAAMQQYADADYLLTPRYQPKLADLKPKDRATWNGLIFDIRAAYDPDGRRRELHVYAKADA